jgi:endonuclease/exonuclease/phosphatase family metal-dependent hydrolase
MSFRVVTLNLEQNHKRWERRRPLIEAELARWNADVVALNEVSIPLQTARGLKRAASAAIGKTFNLVQQTRANGLSEVEGEALLSPLTILETANLDFRTHDIVALVARLDVGGTPVDVYVTHLYRSVGDDSLRLFQVQRLLAWIDSRNDVGHAIVCGDFNASLDKPSAALMASRFRPTQTAPTAFTPLAGRGGEISHPYWPRMDRCIDYIWVSEKVKIVASGTCFDRGSPDDASLWPSDHAGVWADLELA